MINIFTQSYFGNTLFQYIVFLGIIIISILIGKLIYLISKHKIRKSAKESKNRFDDLLVEILEKPLVFLLVLLGFYSAFNFITLPIRALEIVNNVLKILATINVGWFIVYFSDALLVNYITPVISAKSKIDDHLLTFFRRLIKTVIVLVVILVVIDNFGFDITSLIAGLGIGGLAFALAAKDMLANIFGGLTVLIDKPFKLNDRIKIEGYDGWVRDIGLRSTKIETLDGFQLIVPNAKITENVVENVSRENSRKVKMIIGVTYDTSMKKMEEAKVIMEDIILKNKDTEDKSNVYFTEFGDSSLNFTVIYWIKNT
jgi:MscS family membrane protein